MSNNGDVRTTVERLEDGQWKFKGAVIVEATIAAGIGTTPIADWLSYPKGAIYVQGNKLMKDGLPHSLQVYFNHKKWKDVILTPDGYRNQLRTWSDLANGVFDGYVDEAKDLKFNAVTMLMGNTWFTSEGIMSYDELWNNHPEVSEVTFDKLEILIKRCIERDVTLHLWGWGDEERKWTSVGLRGGINGEIYQNVQDRFIARLGKLGGHSYSEGFDLHEWMTVDQARISTERLKAGMSYPYPCGARGLNAGTYNSVAGEELHATTDAKPTFYEERFSHGRWGRWSTQYTKDWRDWAVANDVSAIYGFFDDSPVDGYPNPEILRG